jgi:GNAT superfamily N-acetyltransferase
MKNRPFSPEFRSMPENAWCRPILTADAVECGAYKWSLFLTREEQAHRYTQFMDRIPLEQRWPLALFEDLEIYPSYHRQGYGRKAVQLFLKDAAVHGAVCSVLRIGWGFSEDPATARAWKTAFYGSEGFIEMKYNYPEPVLMYKDLRASH